MDRHRDDEVFDALHAMGDVESSPLGLDGRYADGRIEPATFIYSHVRRLVPGPFKKAVPRIAVGLLFASLGMVFVRMLTGIETGWLAAVLRVGSVPFGLLCGILFAYLGLRLMFERAPKGEDGRRRGLGEGCLMRGFCAPILLALAASHGRLSRMCLPCCIPSELSLSSSRSAVRVGTTIRSREPPATASPSSAPSIRGFTSVFAMWKANPCFLSISRDRTLS